MITLRRLLLISAGCGVVFASGTQAQELSKQSPFMPAGGAVAPTPGQPSTHELVGMVTMSSQTLVGIADATTKRSLWIPVGKTVEGIEVVSCDPQKETAVVRVNGEEKSLGMRAAAVIPGPLPTVVARPTPTAPGFGGVKPVPAPINPVQAEQEREARMLVSDLLEIGMQQRKAYEEAQKKAAQNNAPGARR